VADLITEIFVEGMFRRRAGADVHKDSLAVCVKVDGRQYDESLGTTTCEIPRLADCLSELGVMIVAMEATGVYWRPLWSLPEGWFQLLLANPQHIKRVPGRKADLTDAQRIWRILGKPVSHRRSAKVYPQSARASSAVVLSRRIPRISQAAWR
jgi:transposase